MLHIPQSGGGPMRFDLPEAVRAREDHHYVSHMFTFQGVQVLLPKTTLLSVLTVLPPSFPGHYVSVPR